MDQPQDLLYSFVWDTLSFVLPHVIVQASPTGNRLINIWDRLSLSITMNWQQINNLSRAYPWCVRSSVCLLVYCPVGRINFATTTDRCRSRFPFDCHLKWLLSTARILSFARYPRTRDETERERTCRTMINIIQYRHFRFFRSSLIHYDFSASWYFNDTIARSSLCLTIMIDLRLGLQLVVANRFSWRPERFEDIAI